MKTISSDMIIMWLGNHADIPAGYERVTSLDGYFIKGWGSEAPNTTGGSAGHSHTSPAHTHTLNHHTHTYDASGSVNDTGNDNGENGELSAKGHSHTNKLFDSTSGGNLVDAVSYASVNWEPLHQRLIFIKPTTATAFIPADALLISDKTSLKPGWEHDTSVGARFLKGADTEANPSQAGSDTHEHAINHTHSVVSHTHQGRLQYTSNDSKASNWSGSDPASNHEHYVYFASTNLSSSAYVGNAGSADTGIEPAHKKVRLIKNNAGKLVGMPIGGIVLSLTLTEAPKHWAMKTELQNVFIKITNENAEILTSGGNNTHSHAASNSHTHTDTTGAHTHTATTSGWFGNLGGNTGTGSKTASTSDHRHNISNVSTNTATWQATTVQADPTTWQPPYRTVSFLELLKDPRLAKGILEM
jgi:hypothetical protein